MNTYRYRVTFSIVLWCHRSYQAYQIYFSTSTVLLDLPKIETCRFSEQPLLPKTRGSASTMAEAKDSQGIEMAQAASHQHDDVEDIKPAAGEITEVQGDSHFYETVTAAPLSPWSKTSVQLYLILLVAALNATTSGFDGVSPTNPQYKHFAEADAANSRSSAPSMPWISTRSTSTTRSWDQARECESRNHVYLKESPGQGLLTSVAVSS